MPSPKTILFVLNEAHFFLSHRLAVATAAREAGFEVHVATPDDHVWAPVGFDVSEITKAGFHYHSIPMSRRGLNPLQEIRTFLSLLRLYRYVRPDLVHLLTIKAIIYGGIAARFAGVPSVVIAFTGLGQIFSGRGLHWSALRFSVRLLLKIAAGHPNSSVIVQNPDDDLRLTTLGIVPIGESVLIRGSGIDVGSFKPLPLSTGAPLVILASRMIWEKGILEFVEAARFLRGNGSKARFALVGNTHPSNPRAVPGAQLKAWDLEGVVEYWGRREDMSNVLQESHIVCLPSKYGEGVPRILIEAAAAGRPLVATDIPGCREVVRDGITGLLVPCGDVNALARAIAHLAGDVDLRRRMGAKARQLAETEFDERTTVTKTLAVYDALLRGGVLTR
jgi:glycosyltransferase involved in cell wall biosynthesis